LPELVEHVLAVAAARLEPFRSGTDSGRDRNPSADLVAGHDGAG